MNPQISGVIRHIITTAGGALVTQGVIDSEGLNTVAGAVVVIIGVVWSLIAKKKS